MATLLATSRSSRSSRDLSDTIRHRALLRLYERLDTVDELITLLEKYQEESKTRRASCIDISVGRRCLSGFAQ